MKMRADVLKRIGKHEPNPRAKWSDRFEAMVADAADTWVSHASRLAMSGLFPPFYLYFRRSTAGHDGALYMVPDGTDPDPSWELGDPEAYRSNLSRAQVRSRIHAMGRQLPIIDPEGNPRARGAYGPIPASTAGVAGDRWEVSLPTGAGLTDLYLVAELSASHFTQPLAQRIVKVIANTLGKPVVFALQPRRMPRSNPTLVHHGKTGAAEWHVTSPAPGFYPLADLYGFKQPAAARIARLIANLVGSQVALLDNYTAPGLPKTAELKAHRRAMVGGNPRRDFGRLVFGQPMPAAGISATIRPGDRVTWVDRFGKQHTGRAVMPSTYGGWVLNMGGAHGTPAVVDDSNIVKVSPRKNPGPGEGRPGNNRDFAANTIRASLKKRSGKPWSVTVGRGTAWGWIRVDAAVGRRTWRWVLPAGASDSPENYQEIDSGQPGGHAGPADRAELAALLGLERLDSYQGVSIPGQSDFYDEFMDRAQGKTPETIGKPHWNPSRSRRARGFRAARRAALYGLNRKTVRASTKALLRPARPGNAAQTLYYLEAARARTLERAGSRAPRDNPSAALAVGERVHVPYTGRSTRRSSERATVLGVTGAGVHVLVKRGKKTHEEHTFPLEHVRRVAQRGPRAWDSRVTAKADKLELAALRAQILDENAAEARAEHELNCAQAIAKVEQPPNPDWPAGPYRKAMAQANRFRLESAAHAKLSHRLRQRDPDPMRYQTGASFEIDDMIGNPRDLDDPSVVARAQRITSLGTDLKQEWRIRKLSSPDDQAAAREAVGPHGEIAGPFAQERRYIRDGVFEPWQFMGFYMSRHKGLEDIFLPPSSWVLDPELAKIHEVRRALSEAKAEAEAVARARAVDLEERSQVRAASERAFKRMLDGASAVNRELAIGWNQAMVKLKPLSGELSTDARFMANYESVMLAVTVPAKAKAIRFFLADLAASRIVAAPGLALSLESDAELDATAHHGRTKAIRAAAKRELSRRGVAWSGEGEAARAVGRYNNPRRRRAQESLDPTPGFGVREPECPTCHGAGIFDPDHGTLVNIGPPCPTCSGDPMMRDPGEDAADRWSESNPRSRRALELGARLVRDLGFDAMADEVMVGRADLRATIKSLLDSGMVAESRKVILRAALQAIDREAAGMKCVSSRAELADVKRDAYNQLERELGRPIPPERRNPRGERTELERAKATARLWNEFEPTTSVQMDGPPEVTPRTMVALGKLHSVVYESNKYAGGRDNPGGEMILYEHKTKRPRPVLATDPDGRHVFIVGGKMKVTANGLVN
jgi:hypothetical protein